MEKEPNQKGIVSYLKHFREPQTIRLDEIAVSSDRIREDVGDLKDLCQSLEEVGQLVPIVVRERRYQQEGVLGTTLEGYDLIAGLRRIKAFKKLGWERIARVEVRNLSAADLFQVELDENLRRKNLSPAEKSQAIAKLHTMRQAELGAAVPTKAGTKSALDVVVALPAEAEEFVAHDPALVPATRPSERGWSLKDTADAVGISRAAASRALTIAKAIQIYPELKDCKTESEILRRLKRLRLDEAKAQHAALTGRADRIDEVKSETKIEIIQGDSTIIVPTLPDEQYAIALLDPPYGVDIEATHKSPEAWDEIYMDDQESAHLVTKMVIERMMPKLEENAMVFVFGALQFMSDITKIMREAGLDVDRVPMIYYRTFGQGPVKQARKWFARSYEAVFYGHKGLKPIIRQGNNVLPHDQVKTHQKLHPTQKPVKLIMDLLSRVALPDDWVLDPFAGSGVTGRACMALKLKATLIEIDAKYVGVSRYLIHGEKPDANMEAPADVGTEDG